MKFQKNGTIDGRTFVRVRSVLKYMRRVMKEYEHNYDTAVYLIDKKCEKEFGRDFATVFGVEM